MAIDWVATGAWMQAWAGFAQAAAVFVAAWKGADAFKMWRRQKIEERRMEAAERILTVAYRVRRALSTIRHPMMWSGALSAAEKGLVEKGVDLNGVGAGRKDKLVHVQAVFDRISHFDGEWDEIAAVTPIAAALFGRELEESLEHLWRQRNMVSAAAEGYLDDDGADPAFTRKLRADLWEALGTRGKGEDKIGAEIAGAVTAIEGVLLPILRADSRA